MWISHSLSLSDSTLLLASTSLSFVLISVHHCLVFLDFFHTFSQPSHFFDTFSLYFLAEKNNPKRSYPFKKNVVQMFFFLQLKPWLLYLPSPSSADHFSSVHWSQRCMPISQMCRTLLLSSSDCNYSANILRKGHIPTASLALPLLCCYLVSLNGKLRRIHEQHGTVCLMVYMW